MRILAKSEHTNDMALRGGDAWQGGCVAMVSAALSVRENWAVRFASSGAKIAAAEHSGISETHAQTSVNCMASRQPSDIQRTAPRHLKRTGVRNIRMRNPLNSGSWANVRRIHQTLARYTSRHGGYWRKQMAQTNPKCPDTLKLAARVEVGEIP